MTRSLFSRSIPLISTICLLLAACGPRVMPTGRYVTWHLLVLGDSSFSYLAEAYAEQIREDVNVQVEVYDYAIDSLSADEVLEAIQTEKTSNMDLINLSAHLAQAEVIVMYFNPLNSEITRELLSIDGCYQFTSEPDCKPESLELWITELKMIWAEIIRLRNGKPTIMRGTDLYNPLVGPWQDAGIFESCTKCMEIASDAARQAAEAYNIPFLSRLDLVNGPDHNLDPRSMGILAEDGMHPAPLLAQFTALKLAELGYDPVTLP